MNFRNIFLLLKREVRDQFRDRRTLFMIFVLPLLLYPVLGIFVSQAGQYSNHKPSFVTVFVPSDFDHAVQEHQIFPLFALNEKDTLTSHFSEALFSGKEKQRLLVLTFETIASEDFEQAATNQAKQAIDAKKGDVALIIPPSFLEKLRKTYDEIRPRRRRPPPSPTSSPDSPEGTPPAQISEDSRPLDIPRPNVIYSTATQKSLIARNRLDRVLDAWNHQLGAENIKKGGLLPEVASPIEVQTSDIAAKTSFHGASVWAKSLPIFLLIWALTGAFYPAIDLCAGEKERGTLETLLSSPADRTEIVVAKLLTVMTFSVLTSFLNILGIAITGYFLISRISGIGIPSMWTPLWLFLALIPAAALFSALCIALAAYARSSKEGQYYLTPLMLIVLPLVLFPTSVEQELTLGSAFIPVSGIVQVLGALLEGDYYQGFKYLPVVTLVTVVCCVVAIRWSVDQFNSESVLFRESERFRLRPWIIRLLTTRLPKPTPQAAILCGMLILVARYFLSFLPVDLGSSKSLILQILMSQLLIILLPVLLLTAISSSSVWKTLRLSLPRQLWTIPVAFFLALCWHPINLWVGSWVVSVYPVSGEMTELLQELQYNISLGSPWVVFLLLAVLPGFCEEITFRGYILTGLDTPGHRFRAVMISAIFFGATHAILQQSILAAFTGILLGWLAIQTGSIWPTIVFHITHNGINVLIPNAEKMLDSPESFIYGPWGIIVSLFVFMIFVVILRKQGNSEARIGINQ